MAEQLGLYLSERLSYASKNFVCHSGVSEVVGSIESIARQPSFSINWVFGAKRSGKTHLSIKLSDVLGAESAIPFLIEGKDYPSWRNSRKKALSSGEVLIVDNAEELFIADSEDLRGQFVHLVEETRTNRGKLVLLSSYEIGDLPTDGHVKSRLNSGNVYRIQSPSDEDMRPLIEAMALQRGLKLQHRKILFLHRRVGRDIAAIERYFDRLTHLSRVLGARIKFPLLGDAVERY